MRIPNVRSLVETARTWLLRNWVLVPILVVYIWSFPFYEQLNNPNELVRVYMTLAIVDNGTYDITDICLQRSWVNDRSVVGDRAYSSKAPGASLAGVPVYAATRAVARLLGLKLDLRTIVRILRLVVVAFPAFVFLLAFRRYLFSRGVSPFVAEVSFLGYAVASTSFSNIHQFAGHTPSGCALFGSYILLSTARDRGRWEAWRAMAFGFLLATAPVMEYQALVPSVVVGIAFLSASPSRRLTPLLAACLGGVVPLGLMAHFHQVAFGSPLTTGYSFIENPAFQMDFSQGWMGVTYPHLSHLLQLLISTDTGLFVFSPLLLAGLLVPPLLPVLVRREGFRERGAHVCVISGFVVVLLVLFVGSLVFWRAGWTAGPRYLTSLVPFATVLSMFGLEASDALWGLPVRVLAICALITGVIFSGLSGAIYPHLPVTFQDPLFQLVVPMLADGFVPYNLGMRLGLGGLVGFIPVLLLGILPLILHVIRLSHPSFLHRVSIGVTAMLLVALALMPLYRQSLSTPFAPFGLEDLNAVYTSWEPLDDVRLFERNGCSVKGSIWQIRCPDPVSRGRLESRLGMRWLAMLHYRRSR